MAAMVASRLPNCNGYSVAVMIVKVWQFMSISTPNCLVPDGNIAISNVVNWRGAPDFHVLLVRRSHLNQRRTCEESLFF
jgi:hypothetical protein